MRVAILVLLIGVWSTSVGAQGRATNDCFKRGEPAKAVAACSELIARNSRDADAYTSRAHAFERLGKCEESLSDAERAVALNSSNSLHLMNRAAALVCLKRYDAAETDVLRGLSMTPKDEGLIANLAYIYEMTGKKDLAIARYQEIVRLAPESFHGKYAKEALVRLAR